MIIEYDIDKFDLGRRDKNDRLYPFTLLVYLMNEREHNEFLIMNPDLTTNDFGWRPAYLLNPEINKWLKENIGPGQHGFHLPGEMDYQVYLEGQKWWYGWSYAHNPYHVNNVTFHFRYEEDALAFKLRWT